MPVGPFIRSLFGRHEHRVAALYRACFVDLADYVRQLQAIAPASPARILEVGCGEGAVTERLAGAYPDADILAIDITPRAGRLYRGPTDRVQFEAVTVQEVARRQPAAFDLVIISDVIHHVPLALRAELLAAASRALAPGGALLLKDWERRASPIHWLCYLCDRWITGDRVRYPRRAEIVSLLDSIALRVADRDVRIGPWSNNFLLRAGR